MEDTLFINRELSWIDFNTRVLALAENRELPLAERLRYLGICSNNLSEFFQVRVSGLQMLVDEAVITGDSSGLTPQAQLEAVTGCVHALFQKIDALYCEFVADVLPQKGYEITSWELLSGEERLYWAEYLESDILPLLDPIGFSQREEQPLIKGGVFSYWVELATEEGRDFAVVQLPSNLERFIRLQPQGGKERFITLESLLYANIESLFTGRKVKSAFPFILYRSAGMTVDESISQAFLPQMEKILMERERSFPIRIDIGGDVNSSHLAGFCETLGAKASTVFLRTGLIATSGLLELAGKLPAELAFPVQEPLSHPELDGVDSLFDFIREKDRVLFHPYDSYFPVIRFLKEAAEDKDVLAIKQTLYRTCASSLVVAALKLAAQKGKSVTVLCEVKARFDEELNIAWARELEDAGVQVVYGVKNLKTHAKATLVIRKGVQGIERFMHLATGNYNEKTATFYTDYSLFTSSKTVGSDLSQVFNMVTGYALPEKMRRLRVSPLTLKLKLLKLIKREKENAERGEMGFIRAKMNSLADTEIIHALYSASAAGVRIELNVRGICMLKPGVAGLSEGIRVVSILGRNLEHARIFSFHNGGNEKFYISSADWMPRNLERRIELLIPVVDTDCKEDLRTCLDMLFSHTVWRWELNGDSGRWDEYKGDDVQSLLYKNREELYSDMRSMKPLLFEAHQKGEN